MIAKHALGHDFHGVLTYVLREGLEGREHEAVLLGGDMSGRHARELACEFAVFHRLNAAVRRAVFHASLRLPEDEHLNDGQWREVAQVYLEQLGYTDTGYIVVRHPEHHIHIVASRIRFDGTAVDTWADRWRGLQALEAIERHFGLSHPPRPHPAPGRRRRPRAQDHDRGAAEREGAARNGRALRGADPSSLPEGVSTRLLGEASLALARQRRWNSHMGEDGVLRYAALRLARAHPEAGIPILVAALETARPGSVAAFPGGRAALAAQMEATRVGRPAEYVGLVLEGEEYGTR